MIINSYILSAGGSPDTTADKKQVYLVIGDSNAGDTSAAVTLGPTTPPNTCFKWNGSQIVELTTLDMSNAGAQYGTAYKQFALNRFNNTGFKSIIVNRASGGSEYSSNGDSNNWTITGSNYTNAVNAARACLLNQNLTKLKGIFVILGTNDVREGTISLSTIKTAMDSLYSRLQLEFPDTPIYVVNTGIYNGSGLTIDARKWGMLKNLVDIVNANSNIYLTTSLYELTQWGYGFGDSLHLNTAGYNKLGEILERNVTSTETNKEVKRVICGFHTSLSTSHSNAYKTFILSQQSSGRWFNSGLDSLQIFVANNKNNMMKDFSALTVPLDSGFDFTPNAYIATDATTPKYYRTNFIPSVCQINTTVSDFIEGVKTGINSSTAAGTLFGTNSGSLRRVFQNNTTIYNAHSTTSSTYATDTVAQNNTRYAISRGSGTQYLYKNGVIAHQANTTTGALSTRDSYIGGSGSGGSYITCQYYYYFYSKRTGFDLAAFEADLETLMAALAS